MRLFGGSPGRSLKLVGVNAGVLVLGFLLLDLVVSSTPSIYWLIPNAFRIHDARLHHALAKNVDNGAATWGGLHYRFSTNSLGYRDAHVRTIPLRSEKPTRVLFLGDSFAEAIGMPWERSFVGIFAAHRPDVDVLNGGVSSYAPSIYLRRAEALLAAGYQVDHVIVFIDISDIQDEAMYAFDAAGNVVDADFTTNTAAQVDDPPATIQRRAPAWKHGTVARWVRKLQIVLAERFVITKNLGIVIKNMFRRSRFVTGAHAAPAPAEGRRRDCSRREFCLVRSMWTVDGAKLTVGYGDLGVDGAIAKAEQQMDHLAALLRARGIGLSVAVYPWPDQMRFDRVDSRQVTMWRDWCGRNRCEAFIDTFPDFFKVRDARSDWLAAFYIPGDFHFNAEGNRLVAERLIKQTDAMFRSPR